MAHSALGAEAHCMESPDSSVGLRRVTSIPGGRYSSHVTLLTRRSTAGSSAGSSPALTPPSFVR